MLAEELKKNIQFTYTQLLKSRGLIPRYGQKKMIAEITNNLEILIEEDSVAPPICVIEAGTGTGKTLAYLLGVIPLAQKLGYKTVISTATIALQEQVVFKDIPEVLEGSDFKFTFALAKGRRRYICLSKLNMLLDGSDSLQALMDLYGDDLTDPNDDDKSLYESMLSELNNGNWSGDREDWKNPLSDTKWQPLTVDRRQCSGANCSYFRNCCFYSARDSLENADCIVSNHDLVLTDLAMGGGAILPEPEKCIYVFDEAHHLPIKSNNHFSAFTGIRGTEKWLGDYEKFVDRLIKYELITGDQQKKSKRLTQNLIELLNTAWLLFEQLLETGKPPDKYEHDIRYIFDLGVIPEEVRNLSANLASDFSRLTSSLEKIDVDFRKVMDENSSQELVRLAEEWYPILGANIDRAESNLTLWLSYANQDPEDSVPKARWLSVKEIDNGSEIDLYSSPVLAAANLQEHLWEKCGGAILTSATLSALGQFAMIKQRAGLPDQTNYLRIPSPFDFANLAKFVIPKMNCDPSDTRKHTALLIDAIPKLLTPTSAALMLFSSRRQMLEVLEGLPVTWIDLILCQDDYQKAQLLKYHRQRIDEGEGSIIFGLASFAEGIDLPGKYCQHVLIAKIPFSPPNDPIEKTLASWLEMKGENPFMTLSVPDAAMRLVQASGRLLRSEKDSGRITLFDERIVNRRYGKAILESIPPYRKEIFLEDLS